MILRKWADMHFLVVNKRVPNQTSTSHCEYQMVSSSRLKNGRVRVKYASIQFNVKYYHAIIEIVESSWVEQSKKQSSRICKYRSTRSFTIFQIQLMADTTNNFHWYKKSCCSRTSCNIGTQRSKSILTSLECVCLIIVTFFCFKSMYTQILLYKNIKVIEIFEGQM